MGKSIILSEIKRKFAEKKRKKYLIEWRKKHGMDYYKSHREEILEKQRIKREIKKGAPLNVHNKINYKDMTKEEQNKYHKDRMRRSREEKKKAAEEEKKAIEILKEIKDVRGIRQDVEGEDEDLWALGIAYNLIDKQQKEIEKLKNKNKKMKEGLKNE